MQKNKRVSDHTSSWRKVRIITRKNNKCVRGRKRGRTTRKKCLFMMKESTRLQEEADAAFDKQFGSSFPDVDVPSPKFEEQKFGRDYKPHQYNLISPLSARLVSIALFDGDKMVYACTGIALPRGTSGLALTRFLTSSRLITIFEHMRRKNDKLKVAVRLPNKKTIAGILGLYDKYIAIVTSLGFHNVRLLDMYQETAQPDLTAHPYFMEAVGRAYESCNLMSTTGKLINIMEQDLPVRPGYEDLFASTCEITEAGLGGPLVDSNNGKIVGMNICFHNDTPERFHNGTQERVPLFLPWNLLCQRLENYDILIPYKRSGGIVTPYRAGFSIGKPNNISQRSYEPPGGASRVIPSGFLDIWNWLDSMGYPKPPPLMLELNGRLLRRFEDVFGWLHAWKGYKYRIPGGHGENAWPRFDEKIVATISRRVVSLVSFTGEGKRFFSCTGFLVSIPAKYRHRLPHPIVVTSASLVRTCDATDTIDEKMRIEVFLPPNQRLNGTLCLYHSAHNIAVVNVKGLHNIRPVDIKLCPEDLDLIRQNFHLPERVVAIGREPEGLLCASMGKLINPKNIVSRTKVERSTCGRESEGVVCASVGEPVNSKSIGRKYERSTCEITKVGIGGPLIDLDTGDVVGMNFYDGKPGRTPYIPVLRVCEVLFQTQSNHSGLRVDHPDEGTCNRWQVPKPYWYHGLLEVDRFGPIPMRGRILD